MMRNVALIAGFAMLLSACGGGEQGNGGASQEKTPSPEAAWTPEAGEESRGEPLKPEKVAQALQERRFGQVHAQTSEHFRNNISEEQMRSAYETFAEGVSEWKHASLMQLNDGQYRAWTDREGERGIVATFDAGDVITSLRLVPLQRFTDTDDKRTGLAYGLPFEGEWYVFWGGRNVLANYHYEYEGQRYAYDFVRVEDGYSYRGDETKNESYYAFGQPVLAPQEGEVVHVVNDIADNVPVGAMNEEQPAGNVVVIDHGNGEFSFLAHLQAGSVKVEVGDRVEKGEVVGLCGNSGNSSEPHLHYQVSDKPDLFEGKSIRVQWENELDPLQGEFVGGK
ncbi:M23 family metallopeptidase [Cohnella hongkongensis]|uniref:M23 family metallopeptidase n=1 Tax=Cohnella hongkongensis TaxID=178337 RepID=A0ABV9FB10_9BACL